MKIAKISLGILFLLFAAVQYNDPDPWLWIFIYGLVSFFCFASAYNKSNKKITLGVIILGVLFSLIYAPGVYDWFTIGSPGEIVASMKVNKPYVEESREFFGLWMSIAALIFIYKKD